MFIFIKTLTGRTLSLDVQPTETILALKTKIFERDNVPVAQQKLIFAGKQLDDEKTLADLNIQKETVLHLVLATSVSRASSKAEELDENVEKW
jgi:large subunit ribosomal protein L40e